MLSALHLLELRAFHFPLYKKAVKPLSSVRYAFVAKETVRLYYEMVDGEDWPQKQVVTVDSINQYLSKVCLFM